METQPKFNLKSEVYEPTPGWSFSTWSDVFGRWWYEVRGPKGAWEGFGFWNEREARQKACQAIILAR
jgi:hypothetical protein